MLQSLRDRQLATGAILSETGIPDSFGNDLEVLEAAQSGVALCDRSHWGLLQLTGADRIRYLHNQSTNNFQILQPGQGCDTLFVTSTARTLDLATVYVTEESLLILVSPNRRQYLLEWLDRFIFPMDKVQITDVSQQYAIFNIIGAESQAFMAKLGLEIDPNVNYGQHYLGNITDLEVRIAVGSGLGIPGFTLITPINHAESLWLHLKEAGAMPMGDRAWEQLRILQGRPAPDHELTNDYNPLEAGLWYCLSFDKGCYIGQETITRVNTYKAVKQKLWGIKLTEAVDPGTIITVNGEKVGILTSYTDTPEGAFGLGYIKTKAGDLPLTVEVGNATGEVIAVPFLRHEYYEKKA